MIATRTILADVEQPIQLRQREREAAVVGKRQQLVLGAVRPSTTTPVSNRAVADPKGLGHSHNAAESRDKVHGQQIDTARVITQAIIVACAIPMIRHNGDVARGKKTPFNVAAGRRLARLRLAVGLTQEEMGWKLGVTRQAVGNYEQGIRDLDAETMSRLFAEWRVSTDYVYRGDFFGMPAEIRSKLDQVDMSAVETEVAAKPGAKGRPKKAANS